MTPDDATEPTPEEIAQIKEISRAIKEAIVRSLPPEMAAMRKAHAKSRKAKERDTYKRKREEIAARTRRIVESICTGFNQMETAKALGLGDPVVSRALDTAWPFPAPGRDNRYILVRLNPKMLASLDAIAGDMLLSRCRALEQIAHAALEEDAIVARRTLHVVRKRDGM